VEAMTMGDRIAVMKDGILQQVDSPGNLYNRPANKFVAGFIGSPAMNFFEVERVTKDGETLLSLADVPLPLAFPLEHGDRALTLGIRPENIYHPQYLPPDIEPIALPATVKLVEMMGNELIVYSETVAGTEFVARLDPRVTINAKDSLNFLFDAQRLYYFDREMETVLV
jgi:multiple sugar transport system ATP-binding protein